jgi:phosphoribosylglycinamide formyltransferase-1
MRADADIRLVVSSSPTAYGLLRAKRAGVPTELTPMKPSEKSGAKPGAKRIDWEALDSLLRSRGVTHLFLAGFMKVIPAAFIERWEERILNLHPSLLPAYPGLNSIERAYQDRVDVGLTVHEVTAEVDAGRIFCQRCCVKANELSQLSLEDVEQYVHINEQRAVKEAIFRWNNQPT